MQIIKTIFSIPYCSAKEKQACDYLTCFSILKNSKTYWQFYFTSTTAKFPDELAQVQIFFPLTTPPT